MGKIHDALLKSQKNNHAKRKINMHDNKAGPFVVRGNNHKKHEKLLSVQESPKVDHAKLDDKLIVYHQPESIEAGLFRLIRTNILFPKDKAQPRTILITSVSPGDGKSLIASNLAISLSQGLEEHVMLIDCDLRQSKIDKLFGLGNPKGVGEHLTKDISIDKLLVKTVIKKLSILPSGLIKSNPTEMISSKKMFNLITEVKNRYDDRYIIIDSAPPNLAAETNALARIVDGVIIIVKHRHTQRRMIAELVESFGKEKIFGVVMNYVSSYSIKYYGLSSNYYKIDKER